MHKFVITTTVLMLVLLGACAPKQSAKGPVVISQLPRDAATSYAFLRFEDAKRSGHVSEALDALAEWLSLDPQPPVYDEGALYLLRLGRIDEARELLKVGLEDYPASRPLTVSLANTYFAEKRHDDAIVTLQDYLEKVPDDWTTYKDIALIYLDAQRHAEALDALAKIPKEHQGAAILYYRAKASIGLGLTHKATADLKAAVKKDPTFVEAWAELAYLYEMDKDYLNAEGVYNRLVEMGENSSEVFLRLINLNIKLNNPDKALEIFLQGPRTPSYDLEAATLFLDEKFYEQARAILMPLSLTKMPPQHIWFYLAVLAYDGDNDADSALEYLSKVPESDKRFHRAVRFRIQLLMDRDRKAEALKLIQTQQKAHPDNRDYILLESAYFQREKDYQRALDILEKAKLKWPKDTEVLYSMGVVYEKLGDDAKGLAIMEEIITINPDHADALNYVGYLLAEQGKDLDRALLLVTRALELDPENGFVIDSLAWVNFQLGNIDKAWQLVQSAVEHTADEPTIWEHYGDIAFKLGMKSKAREGYRNSLEFDPGNKAVLRKLEQL